MRRSLTVAALAVAAMAALAPAAHASVSRSARCHTHLAHNARPARHRARCASARSRLVGRRVAIAGPVFSAPLGPADHTLATVPALQPAAAPEAQPAAAPAPAPDPLGRAVQVSAAEFHFTVSRKAVAAGPVHVQFSTYAAEDPHDLVLVRKDGSGRVFRFDEQDPENASDQQLDLTTGTWILFCDIADHEAKGMKTELTVR